MRIAFVALAGLAAIAAAACGSSDRKLDCAWLASNNCWKTTVAAAKPCAPSSSSTGKLSADGKACSYDGGASVSFADPVVLPLPDNKAWNFTVTNGGATCVSFQSGSSIALTTSAGTVRETTSGFGVTIACPDGSRYSAENAFELLGCGGDGGSINFGDLPGHATFSSDASVSLSLIGGADGGVHLFTCEK
jgi:hypothetical protein